MEDNLQNEMADTSVNDDSNLEVSEQANDETNVSDGEVDFSDLSAEEQAATLDAIDDTQETESSEGDNTGNEDLNALYSAQMDNSDMKLDKPILVKYNGKVHKVDSVNELKSLAEQGISITKKSQRMSDQTTLLAELEANGYTAADLRALATEHKGEELTKLEPSHIEIDEIATGILESDYADDFRGFVGEMPESASNEISADPRILDGLAKDIQSGLAQNLMADTRRNMDLHGMKFIDAYIASGKKFYESKSANQSKRNTLASQPRQKNRPQPKQKDTSDMSIAELDAMIDKY